uniref:Coiled-coil domain containing 148 n=1 Tax=Macrostomum lignano TaxID=282301 RepID=A0A1I8FQ75_9PLAT
NEEALRSLEELDAVLRSHECLLTAPASSYSTPKLGTAKPQCPPALPTVQPKSPLPFMRTRSVVSSSSNRSLRRCRLHHWSFEDATRDEEDIDSDIETAGVPSVSEILNLFNKQNVLSKAKKPSSSKQPAEQPTQLVLQPAPQQGGQRSSSASSFSSTCCFRVFHGQVKLRVQASAAAKEWSFSPGRNNYCRPINRHLSIRSSQPQPQRWRPPAKPAIIAQLQQGVSLRKSASSKCSASSGSAGDCSQSHAAPAGDLFDPNELPPPPPSLLLKPVHSKDPEPAIPAASVATASRHAVRQQPQQPPAGRLQRPARQLTDAELASVPGYSAIRARTPDWKRALLERKNREAIDSFLAAKAEEERQERWQRAVPEWKRQLIDQRRPGAPGEEALPIEERRRREAEEAEKLAGMPEWKRNIILKKKGN